MKIITIFLFILFVVFPFFLLFYTLLENFPYEKFKPKKKYNIQDEMNMLDDAQWVEKVIKSCKTYEQLKVTNKLRRMFLNKYENKVEFKLLNTVDQELYWDYEKMIDVVIYG